MVGWHHQLDGHRFGRTPGVGDGQGGLACCGSWGRKESDTTEPLSWTELSQCHRFLQDAWTQQLDQETGHLQQASLLPSFKSLLFHPSNHYIPLYSCLLFCQGWWVSVCVLSIWLYVSVCLCVCIVFGYKHVLWRQAGLPGLKSCYTFYKLDIVGQLTSPMTQFSQL